MSFFTHEQVIKTIAFLYPHLQHGKNYLAPMYVADEPEFIPHSDAWIERWRASEPEPTIEYLKQVYAENDLDNWAPPKPVDANQPEITGTQTI